MDEEERKRKRREEERKKQMLKLHTEKKRRSLHRKHRDRRKRDCMIMMPFIVAFQGDPARPFYCNDVRDYHNEPIYELIRAERPFARLERYLGHHIVSIHAKVLVYKAGEN